MKNQRIGIIGYLSCAATLESCVKLEVKEVEQLNEILKDNNSKVFIDSHPRIAEIFTEGNQKSKKQKLGRKNGWRK
tara:strand:+ start:6333 stop:6560 length:228 start_codon:yes stop_codon:yes gene_type:complete